MPRIPYKNLTQSDEMAEKLADVVAQQLQFDKPGRGDLTIECRGCAVLADLHVCGRGLGKVQIQDLVQPSSPKCRRIWRGLLRGEGGSQQQRAVTLQVHGVPSSGVASKR